MMKVHIISCLADNYSYLIHDKQTDTIGIIDPSDFSEVDNIIQKKFKKIDFILNTHHHLDHIGGNLKLKNKYNAKVVGFKGDQKRIPGINIELDEGEIFKFGKINFKIIYIPGHTKGHIAFYSKEEEAIFTGDTLFSCGCGRIFEGSVKEMFNSINKLKKLPKETKIYCGHEYTKKNLEFCVNIEKKNKFLLEKIKSVDSLIEKGLPTIPVTLEEELQTNIFLRCNNESLKNELNMNNASDEQVFEKLRELKDNF